MLTRPGGKSDNVPLVIMAGGWCYTKEIVMPWYGKFFEDLGCATLRFDYRRFGESTGEPRQHLNPWDQIEDYRNALTFAETLSGIDKKRTGIWDLQWRTRAGNGHPGFTPGIRNFNDSGGRWIPDHATRARGSAICAIE